MFLFSILDFNASTSSSPSTQPSTPHQVNSVYNISSESQSSDEGDRLAAQKSTSSQTTPPPPDVDEYNYLYYYDPKNLESTSSDGIKKIETKSDSPRPSTSKSSAPITPLIKLDEEWEIMFARAEGLYAYGHTNEACVLGVKLVDQILKNPPNFIIELPQSALKGKRKKVCTLKFCEMNTSLIFIFYFRLIQSVISCLYWHQKYYKNAIFCVPF